MNPAVWEGLTLLLRLVCLGVVSCGLWFVCSFIRWFFQYERVYHYVWRPPTC